ncbi:MAG: hypothetical protein K8S27_09680 [Candidatus Omnitrophica bacterium]|nr:hypothetical protein [Candidatus Omnitrophota bacterium]
MEKYLRRRLARRFSIIGKEYKFNVSINKKGITVNDRDYFRAIEYLWTIGKNGKSQIKNCPKLKKSNHIDGTINKAKKYKIDGWVGTFEKQKNIEDGNNSLVILARGKLIHEDILKDLKEAGLFTKYIIGEINANFVDINNKPDMATSDRQNLKEDDPRFIELKKYIQEKILKTIQHDWVGWRRDNSTKQALENKTINSWYTSLSPDKQKYAKKLFGTIGSFPSDSIEEKKELYKHGILAFEKLALKDTCVFR